MRRSQKKKNEILVSRRCACVCTCGGGGSRVLGSCSPLPKRRVTWPACRLARIFILVASFLGVRKCFVTSPKPDDDIPPSRPQSQMPGSTRATPVVQFHVPRIQLHRRCLRYLGFVSPLRLLSWASWLFRMRPRINLTWPAAYQWHVCVFEPISKDSRIGGETAVQTANL